MSEIPRHVLLEWEQQAAHNPEKQRRWHDTHGHFQPFLTCWYCGRNQAKCKSKRRYESLEAAQASCDGVNHPTRPRLLVPYRCIWGIGLHWHVTTAKTAARRRRARKRMARLKETA